MHNPKINSGKYRFVSLFLLCSLVFSTLSGCSRNTEPLHYQGYYFNTVITLTFYNETDAQLQGNCFSLCQKYESMLSRTVEGSDIWNINHGNGQPVSVQEETYALLEDAISYCEQTDGQIDITVAPLMDLWNFTSSIEEKAPPAKKDIDAILPHINYKNVILKDGTVTLTDPEAGIDLGFIAKGFIADKLKEYLMEQGVTSALINLGGNILTIGSKPDGSAYTIGVKDPFSINGGHLTTVSSKDNSIVTSGTYERYFIWENTRYHHILDASTGYPAATDIAGVTIICDSSTKADALSTTCLLLGKEKALELLASFPDTEGIFITNDGEIYSTRENE